MEGLLCFNVRTSNKPGIPYHCIITPKTKTNLQKLAYTMVAELRRRVLGFMAEHGLDGDQKGFRLVIENDRSINSFTCHLMAGEGVPAQNPQDWMTSTRTKWVKYAEGAPPSFLDLCAEAASRNAPEVSPGRALLYPKIVDGVFGIRDGDPKADLHFMVLASQPYGNMADKEFTGLLWYAYFLSAMKILAEHNADNDHIRYIANCGSGFQVGPRVHLHVLASPRPLPSIFPSDYGFEISSDGTIEAPSGGKAQNVIINLIQQRRLIQGFSKEALNRRKRLDADLLCFLEGIHIA